MEIKGDGNALRVRFCGIFQIFIYTQQIKAMAQHLINQIISDLALTPTPELVQRIHHLLQPLQQSIPSHLNHLYMLAAISLIYQTTQPSSVRVQQQVDAGRMLEKILDSVKEEEKEKFVQTVKHLVGIQSGWPEWIRQKCRRLERSYGLFRRHQQWCEMVRKKVAIDDDLWALISSFIWVAYVITKQQLQKSTHKFQDQQVLSSTTVIVCDHFFGLLSHEQISTANSVSSNSPQKKQESQKALREIIQNTIETYYDKRFSHLSTSLTQILQPINNNTIPVLQQILNDMDKDYTQAISSSPEQHKVHQLSFLGKDKIESEESLKKSVTVSGFQPVFTTTQSNNENKPDRVTSFPTPISVKSALEKKDKKDKVVSMEKSEFSRLKMLGWVQNCIGEVNQVSFMRFQLLYDKYNKGGYYGFRKQIAFYIEKCIQKFSPSCRKPLKRKSNISTFYVYFIDKLLQMYEEKQIQLIFSDDKSLIAILCLVTELFNFCYHAIQSTYTAYCQIFQLDWFYGFRPINWLGRFINLPDCVSDHLYEVERKFLVKEIWEDDTGYRIITNGNEIVPITEMAIFKRIQHHIQLRISEIVKQVRLSERIISKIYNMVVSIITCKPYLLRQNNIDQIIICSITACLSINEVAQNVNLSKVIEFYDKISLNYGQKDKLYDFEGRELSLLEFYNTIFLSEIDAIVREVPDTDFLLTPNRLLREQRLKVGQELTPFQDKFAQKEPSSLFSSGIKVPLMLPQLQLQYNNHRNSPINEHFHKYKMGYDRSGKSTKPHEELQSLQEEEQEDSISFLK